MSPLAVPPGQARSLPPQARRGVVVAARDLATRAGAQVLEAGGNAADAAVAVALALAVVDCANCGIGGFGGFAVVDRGDGGPAVQVGFNARVPRGFAPDANAANRPGVRVSPPAVLAGLDVLHRSFGRLQASDVWSPAIALAREGFVVGADLAAALRWAHVRHRGLNAAFREVFFRNGEPLSAGDRLTQPRLADTLQRAARDGAAAMSAGPVVASICRTVAEAGGFLDADDFAALDACVADADVARYEDASVHAPAREQCGAGILFAALAALDGSDLGEPRGESYVRAMAGALARGWRERGAAYSRPSESAAQTTHLCAADDGGMMVSMTFTHGPSWFGSGLLDRDSGVLLNTGASIFARRLADGALVALPNLAPVVVRHGEVRYAIGAPGGTHIPAIVAQAIVDLVRYREAPDRVLARHRMSADIEGRIAAEPPLFAAFPNLVRREIAVEEYYGPAGMIVCERGAARGFADPRFGSAHVEEAA